MKNDIDFMIQKYKDLAVQQKISCDNLSDDEEYAKDCYLAEAAECEQIAEWLTELKELRTLKSDYVIFRAEAKKLLKFAVDDMYYALTDEDSGCKSCICDHNGYNEDRYKCVEHGCTVCAKWRYADEALKLLALQYCPDDDGSCSKADVDLREMLDEYRSLLEECERKFRYLLECEIESSSES